MITEPATPHLSELFKELCTYAAWWCQVTWWHPWAAGACLFLIGAAFCKAMDSIDSGTVRKIVREELSDKEIYHGLHKR